MKKSKKNQSDVCDKDSLKNPGPQGEFTRRELLAAALAAGGGIRLTSLITGIPLAFLSHRSMASTGAKYLVYASSKHGDPVNCNAPGSYDGIHVHPEIWKDPVPLNLGGRSYNAAAVWSDLRPEIRARANFFHLRTNTNAHNEMEAVTTVFGAVQPLAGRAPEMIPSVISHFNQGALGSLVPAPVSLAKESILQYEGQTQQIFTPRSIQALFPPGLDASSKAMRDFRDRKIASIYSEVKSNGTPAQLKFLDQYITSENQAVQLGEQLATALASISSNEDADVIRTSVALLALKVTPVVTIRLDFGGDNHIDVNLVREVEEHTSGVATLNLLYEELARYGIQDQTQFAMLNVFGRSPELAKAGGRSHNGNANVMFSFGPNVNPGVIGGLAVPDGEFRPRAQGINSVTGTTTNPDISATQTLHSAAKSLMVACGLNSGQVDGLVTGGKVVQSYIRPT